jgi:hypothetical protein
MHQNYQQRKQCLEFALPKLREICKYLLVLAIQTVMPVGYTILLFSAKQSRENQCNEASRLKKNVSEELSVIYPLEMRRSPFAIEFATFAAKKPQPLCEIWIEKGNGEKGIVWPQAYNAQYNTQRRGV